MKQFETHKKQLKQYLQNVKDRNLQYLQNMKDASFEDSSKKDFLKLASDAMDTDYIDEYRLYWKLIYYLRILSHYPLSAIPGKIPKYCQLNGKSLIDIIKESKEHDAKNIINEIKNSNKQIKKIKIKIKTKTTQNKIKKKMENKIEIEEKEDKKIMITTTTRMMMTMMYYLVKNVNQVMNWKNMFEMVRKENKNENKRPSIKD